MKEIKVRMPISVTVGVRKKRKIYLNLNLFRNEHHHVNNNVKKAYARIAHELLPTLKEPMEQIQLEYTLYLPNKLKRDISNVLSIVDKSFCDAIVQHGLIEDDNYEYLKKVTYMYGGYDPDKLGYVDILIKEVENEKVSGKS